jgi:hypothetical protein
MAVPSLRIPVTADVTGFQDAMTKTSTIVGTATRQISSRVIEMNAGFLASQGAAGGATLAFGRLLPVVGQVILAYKAVTDVIGLMTYATELAKARIAEFNEIAAQANASGFSTDFFQRITKSGGEARDKIDDLTAALQKFNVASTDKLGGSDIQQRLKTLTDAGNFSGNTGVAQLGSANDSEGKLRAIVSLIDQAQQKGERLAAIDLTKTAFGDSVARALQSDSGYLDDMLKRADAMSSAKIVSPEDVGRAIELKERMDEAQKILADKWKPIQDDLATLGMNYHASWVNITSDMAAAVGYATQLYQALKQVPDWFAKSIGGASIFSAITNATTTPESRAASEASLGISSDPKDIGMVTANAQLTAALQNHANVTNAMRQATDVSFAVQKDTSKDPAKKTADDAADAYDRAQDAVEKLTAKTNAETDAVGKGAEVLAEYEAQAKLDVAAKQAGIAVTQQVQDHMQDLAQDAGDAADALAKAKVASDISRGSQTAFLTPEDLAIANQLKGIYGDDIPAALASSEAAALRFNNAIKDLGSLGQQVNSQFFVDFETQIRNGATAMQALQTAGVNALGAIANKLTKMAADNLWSSAFGGSSSGAGGFLSSLFKIGGTSTPNTAAMNTSNATLANGTGGAFYGPGFASGTDNAPGGLALIGENGPEIMNVPKGAQIIPNSVLRNNGGGGVNSNVNFTINAPNADAAGLAKLQVQLNQLQAELPARVVSAVTMAQKKRQL